MFAGRCECGEDKKATDHNGTPLGHGLSYLAFNFAKEMLVIKARLSFAPGVGETMIPPALRPLDAELYFQDISSQGVHVKKTEIDPIYKHGQVIKRFQVTVTINCRRPPKFYTELEDQEHFLSDRRRQGPMRRRATVMDFAITHIVSQVYTAHETRLGTM
jgi:RNA-dependent RNA polymerase